jgi:alpha-maltose-1-phosphate synthase
VTNSYPRLQAPLPALRFEPEAFQLSDTRIMGRQSAGESFLRAAVEASSGEILLGFGPNPKSGEVFQSMVRNMDASVRALWTGSDDLRTFSRLGSIHMPDPSLAEQARLRVRAGSAAYSITGVTHTLSSLSAMRMLAEIPMAPIMPWDGLICTSCAVKSVIDQIFGAQDEYARWKFGTSQKLQRPEMPIIPLGVHADNFVFNEGTRSKARADIGVSDNEVVFLFFGRLSFHAKAHPFQMYTALEDAAHETGQKIVLLQCGWFSNEFIENAFKDGAARFSPGVRHLWLDGRKEDDRKTAWAASDAFLSLSDNIQETFGLTVIEAMAAGLPVIASDWDGYKDIVASGDSGYLVPTVAPETAVGDDLALKHVSGVLDYDRYIGSCSQMIAISQRELRHAITRLVRAPDLRRRMGASGRVRARLKFEWKEVLRQYQGLWAELRVRREKWQNDRKPQLRGRMAEQLPPFMLFSGYATHTLSGRARVRRVATPHTLADILDHPLFTFSKELIPGHDVLHGVLQHLPAGIEVRVSSLDEKFPEHVEMVRKSLAILAKFGMLEIDNDSNGD